MYLHIDKTFAAIKMQQDKNLLAAAMGNIVQDKVLKSSRRPQRGGVAFRRHMIAIDLVWKATI